MIPCIQRLLDGLFDSFQHASIVVKQLQYESNQMHTPVILLNDIMNGARLPKLDAPTHHLATTGEVRKSLHKRKDTMENSFQHIIEFVLWLMYQNTGCDVQQMPSASGGKQNSEWTRSSCTNLQGCNHSLRLVDQTLPSLVQKSKQDPVDSVQPVSMVLYLGKDLNMHEPFSKISYPNHHCRQGLVSLSLNTQIKELTTKLPTYECLRSQSQDCQPQKQNKKRCENGFEESRQVK